MNIQYRHRHGQRSIVRLVDTHTDFVMWIMWLWLWHWYSEMMVIPIILIDAMQCITSVCIVQWQCGLNGMQSLFLCLLILSSILGIIKRYGFRFSQQLLYGSSISVDMELGDCHVYVPILTYSYYGSERPWSYKSTGSSKKSKALAFKKKLRM